uniref:Uncharacterized protein n=1 Tax=Rhizophora mucronata TaxID=61149 RepID=A0A2P2N7R3_RHIMU
MGYDQLLCEIEVAQDVECNFSSGFTNVLG